MNFYPLARGVKASLRSAAAYGLYYSGILPLLAKRKLAGRATVLMYHRVLPESEIQVSPSHPGIIVSTRNFDRQMAFIRRHLQPLDVDRFLEVKTGGEPLPSGSCLVTFDDGWRDNYVHALPILEKYGIPAIIFLPTAFIGTRERFWQERTVELIRLAMDVCRRMPEYLTRLRTDPLLQDLVPCLTGPGYDSREQVARFVAGLKKRPRSETDAFGNRLQALLGDACGETPAEAHFLDWSQVTEMERRGIRFGSHGANHHILTDPGTNPEHELATSKQALESRLTHTVDLFSYPNGDHDTRTVGLAERAGYRLAFTTQPGTVSHGDPPLVLNRNNVHDGATPNVPLFLIRALGLR